MNLKRLLFLLLVGGLFPVFAGAQVRFDADFEGGSMGEVAQLRRPRVRGGRTHVYYQVNGRYDPLNPVDTDLRPSANWFCFRISGIKGKVVHLTMPHNFVAGASYSYEGSDWQHFKPSETEQHSIVKRFTKDTVYIALYKPYTYTYLQERLKDWTSREGVSMDTIGFSHEGRPLQLLHITDTAVPDSGKALVWIHGRVHPSESPASFLLDGLLDYLTSDTPQGRSLRSQIDAYILPFINPDGVANALSRSNALGVNEEINFGRSDDSTVVEVRAVKAVFERLTAGRPFDFMLNCHSQLSETASFWMHRGESTSPLYLRKEWAFTGLVSSLNPCIRPSDMQFSNVASRYAEGWMWDHFADSTIALTIETPYNCYSNNRAGLWVDDDNLASFGVRTIQAVAEYLGLSIPGRYFVETPSEAGEDWTEYTGCERSFLGCNAWEAINAGAVMEYMQDYLPAGQYEVFRYVAGDCIEPEERSNFFNPRTGKWTDPGVHGWVYLGTVPQPEDGPFTYSYTAYDAGNLADALLLILSE